jgi:hypothetical protein
MEPRIQIKATLHTIVISFDSLQYQIFSSASTKVLEYFVVLRMARGINDEVIISASKNRLSSDSDARAIFRKTITKEYMRNYNRYEG